MPESTEPAGPTPFVPLRPPAPVSLCDRLAPILGGHMLTPGRAVGAVFAALCLGIGAVLLWSRPAAPAPELSLPRAGTTAAPATAAASTTLPIAALVVDAAGEVRRPGVYEIPAGARVTDVIDAASGLTDHADRSRLNLAAPVSDGERIFVPALGQEVPPIDVGGQTGGTSPTGEPAGTGQVESAPVNVNTANLAELDTLPGIGPSTAQAIIDHRTQNGRFSSVDQLLDVRGIGDAKLAELRDRVTV